MLFEQSCLISLIFNCVGQKLVLQKRDFIDLVLTWILNFLIKFFDFWFSVYNFITYVLRNVMR